MDSRQFELFGLRWAIYTRSFSESVWKNRLFGWILILGFSCLYLYWSWNIPSPGKAVGALAVVAAAMTFRGEISGLEKFFWMFALFAFLFMELRAIDRDRATYAHEQGEIRKQEAEQFRSIGSGLETSIAEGKAAIGGLKSMLEVTQETLKNTEPQANLLVQAEELNKLGTFTKSSTMGFNIRFTNSGNETARNVFYDSRMYVGK